MAQRIRSSPSPEQSDPHLISDDFPGLTSTSSFAEVVAYNGGVDPREELDLWKKERGPMPSEDLNDLRRLAALAKALKGCGGKPPEGSEMVHGYEKKGEGGKKVVVYRVEKIGG